MSIYTQSKELHDLNVDYQVSDWMVDVAAKHKYFTVEIAPNHSAHLLLKMQRNGMHIERIVSMADFHWSIEGWRHVASAHIRAMRAELAESDVYDVQVNAKQSHDIAVTGSA